MKNLYDNNYRKNLIIYRKQFYSDWEIPVGFHVHHINPRSTFDDSSNPRINHPRTLIALHPDAHYTIHKWRSDKRVVKSFMLSIADRKLTVDAMGKIRRARLNQMDLY